MTRFPNGARVCFVGDSITHNGAYIAHIANFYKQHFPNSGIEFYSCGISGGNLGNSIKVFAEDVLPYAPTHIVLMIGVNDSERSALAEPPSPARYATLERAYRKYGENLGVFFALTEQSGIKLILCTPVPYDEYRASEAARLPGGSALMLGYAERVRIFAREKELPLCDYHAEMTRAMHAEALFAPDGVHPTDRGHAVMASIFLSAQGLSFEAETALPDELEAWLRLSRRLRDVVATEYFVVKDYVGLSHEKRLEEVKKQLREVDENGKHLGTYHEYFTRLMRAYLIDKPKQRQLFDELRRVWQA